MPKSKRARLVSLTRTRAKNFAHKEELVQQIRDSLDQYRHVVVFSVDNMRNNFLQEVRREWNHSRIFMGRKKVMALALGTSPESEQKEGLGDLSAHLSGEVGLLLTNQPIDSVKEYFNNFRREDYARTGALATETFVLPAGEVMQGVEPFPHSLEERLRSLGVPSYLEKGVVKLSNSYTVCKEGELLTSNQAQLLKMFYQQQAEFKLRVVAYYVNGEVHVEG